MDIYENNGRDMERITSRKNSFITHVRRLAAERAYRTEQGEYICDGVKTLKEALIFGAEVTAVLWKDSAGEVPLPAGTDQYVCPCELFDYASPMKNSPGPLFTVKIPAVPPDKANCAVVLEGVQDPGNVGTVIRTANALGIDAVVLTGECADLYHPKTVRATMGAIFRQRVLELPLERLPQWLAENGLPLYGAALSDTAEDVRRRDLSGCAVAVGSEGRGLSRDFLELCRGQVIIPMRPCSESLNAAVAASVIMWEMSRGRL